MFSLDRGRRFRNGSRSPCTGIQRCNCSSCLPDTETAGRLHRLPAEDSNVVIASISTTTSTRSLMDAHITEAVLRTTKPLGANPETASKVHGKSRSLRTNIEKAIELGMLKATDHKLEARKHRRRTNPGCSLARGPLGSFQEGEREDLIR